MSGSRGSRDSLSEYQDHGTPGGNGDSRADGACGEVIPFDENKKARTSERAGDDLNLRNFYFAGRMTESMT